MNHLDELEAESIAIFREVAAQFERPVLMYSVGKDSSVLLRLAQKAFAPAELPFPLLHVDTGYKFAEMYSFRDRVVKENGYDLHVFRNEQAISEGINPFDAGTQQCCGALKTKALLDALTELQCDAAIGGARREEEKSRAKERVFSFRDRHGQWDPKRQRPELWGIYNGRLSPGESIRAFPLSNWTEMDIWHYILRESIDIVPLYFAKKRKVVERGDVLIPVEHLTGRQEFQNATEVLCRFRTLGCSPCTGAVRSSATTVEEIIAELRETKHSERLTRVIDHDGSHSMEQKKREGYF